ncbi:TPA: AAA family ATPase [Photobacterium damselae]
MNFNITLNNIQHVNHLSFSIDLSEGKLTCLSGKNSVGKTTLFRAVRNIYLNDTFIRTAAPYIFDEDSTVEYCINDTTITFSYNPRLGVIDSRQHISDDIKQRFLVELPIPYGERFNKFSQLASIDGNMRSNISLGHYDTPSDLIHFLTMIYGEDRFSNLKSTNINGNEYYFILKDDLQRYYIREDYFSSGEYFLINLYRHINTQRNIIFIDEIDISLDARAQANLLKILRNICQERNVNIIFTTHSLALMKTLEPQELYYIEYNSENRNVTIENRSYNFVKSLLYGFNNYDKYILTEDKVLESFIRYLINKNDDTFFKYEVIYIGGGSQVVDLLDRNTNQEFFGAHDDIIAVLDGDQEHEGYHKHLNNVFFLPFDNIEVEILNHYERDDSTIPRVPRIDGGTRTKKAKNLYHRLISNYNNSQLMSESAIFDYLYNNFEIEMTNLEDQIRTFLSV